MIVANANKKEVLHYTHNHISLHALPLKLQTLFSYIIIQPCLIRTFSESTAMTSYGSNDVAHTLQGIINHVCVSNLSL